VIISFFGIAFFFLRKKTHEKRDHGRKEEIMVKKRMRYVDEEIRDDRGRKLFLRTKYSADGRVVISIRNARYGKGSCLARVQGLYDDQEKLILRIAKIIPFSFALFFPVEKVFQKGK